MTAARFDARAAWAALDDDQRRAIGEAALLQHVAVEAQVLIADAHEGDGPFPPDALQAARRWEHAEFEAQVLLTDTIPVDADLYPDGPDLAALGIRACRTCGCTQESPCAGGCWWVAPDLCSNCAPDTLTATQWNEQHPIGTAVVVTRDNGAEQRSVTRSAAWTLGDGQAVVKVEGISGGYALERVRPAPPIAHAAEAG